MFINGLLIALIASRNSIAPIPLIARSLPMMDNIHGLSWISVSLERMRTAFLTSEV